MANNTRYVIGGSELGRAGALKRCPMCGGIADYISEPTAQGKRYRVRCSNCGLQTEALIWPENAGQRWNARESEGARVITTQEIVEFRAALTDDKGKTACWIETIEGDLCAICIEVEVSMDGREVSEYNYGVWCPREKIAAEGIKWRLWDRKPTNADREREPWGQVGYQVMSDAARAEAEHIRAELSERHRERQRQRAEADRRQMEKLEEAAAQAGEL